MHHAAPPQKLKMTRPVLLGCLLLVLALPASAQPASPLETGSGSDKRCTLVYASNGRKALAGSNEDSTGHFNVIWFLPPEKGKFGRVYFGLSIGDEYIPQGGMNEKGLFYDGASAEAVPKPPPRPRTAPPVEDLHLKAMEECSTVDEVLKLYERHQMSVGDGQVLFGDRFGNSVIMEATGAVVRKKGKYQIATNFFQSRVEPKEITDARYVIADEMLRRSKSISVDLLRRVLNATHWEPYGGSTTATLYSYICDLKRGDLYIYHFHNFEDAVKINLRDELKKGKRYLPLVSLFARETYAAKQHRAQWILELLNERARDKGVVGDEGALALFKALKRGDYTAYRLSVVEGHLIALGYELLRNGMEKEAIQVFEGAVSEYPGSANAYDSLGEAYMKHGDRKLAIESYEKSLELDPRNDNAKAMLKRLRKKRQERTGSRWRP